MRKNGTQDYLAHELIVVSGFWSDAAGDLNVRMVTAANPGLKVLGQPWVICHYSPWLFDRLAAVGVTEGTAINSYAG